jgi:uncharacterized membrane protein YfcA
VTAAVPLHSLWLLLLALPIGFLIGLVGIGGILVVPLLSGVVGLDERDAIGTSLASFVCLGIVGTYSRLRDAKPSAQEWLLYLAMIPAAAAGALALGFIPNIVLSLIVAAGAFATGIWAAFFKGSPSGGPFGPGFTKSAVYGAFTGSASALTGTGGPLVLMPLLLWRGVTAEEALAISKAAQLPIALTATITRAQSSTIDFGVAGALTVMLAAGMILGTRVSAHVSANHLRRTIGYALAGVGIALFAADLFRASR